jgi:hypothetical protein
MVNKILNKAEPKKGMIFSKEFLKALSLLNTNDSGPKSELVIPGTYLFWVLEAPIEMIASITIKVRRAHIPIKLT